MFKKLVISSGEGRTITTTRYTCNQFISLLERSPNLNEIEFDANSTNRFLQSTDEANVSLNNLHFIKVGKDDMTSVTAVYLSVN